MEKIDVIIITHNAKEKLKMCLEALRRNTGNCNYQLTIVNDNSIDGTFEYLKKHDSHVHIINNRRTLGFSEAANVGLMNTFNDHVVLLDDDVEVTKGWLTKLYKQIKNKPEVGIVGCKILLPDNRIMCADYRLYPLYPLGAYEIDRGQRDYIKECDALSGGCWIMQRKLTKKVGYFDKRFFPSQYDDIDYCIRTRLAGYKIIYNGEIGVIHHHLLRGKKQFKKNQQRFIKKWKDTLHKFPLKDSHPADRYIKKGVGFLENRRFRQAFTVFKKVESIDRRFSEPLYVAVALEMLKEFDKAIVELEKVLNLNSANLRARYSLAMVYKKMGNIKQSQIEYTKTINLLKKLHG